MKSILMGRVLSPDATDGGQNTRAALPAGAISRAMFASTVVAQGVPDPSPEDTSTPPPAADAGPEVPPESPGQEEDTGQESTPETTPTTEETPAEGETAEVLSNPNDKFSEVLSGLDETQQSQLLDMLQSVKEGKTSWNEIKSGHKAANKYTQQLEELQRQVEELKATPAAPEVPTQFSDPVAKLKTVQDVEKRLELAEQSVRAIEDFLDENPDGGEVNGKPVTRQQMIATKRQWQDEIRQLPKRSAAIVQQAQFQSQRQQVSAAIRKDYPQLEDEANPDGAMARQLLKDPRFANELEGDYLALAVATGHRILQDQKAKRKAPVIAAKPVGKVAPGKPHVAGGSAPARTTNGASPKDLLNRVSKEGSRNALSALLSTTTVG